MRIIASIIQINASPITLEGWGLLFSQAGFQNSEIKCPHLRTEEWTFAYRSGPFPRSPRPWPGVPHSGTSMQPSDLRRHKQQTFSHHLRRQRTLDSSNGRLGWVSCEEEIEHPLRCGWSCSLVYADCWSRNQTGLSWFSAPSAPGWTTVCRRILLLQPWRCWRWNRPLSRGSWSAQAAEATTDSVRTSPS